MKIEYFLLLFVFSTNSFAQTDTLFFDNFENNNHQWIIDNTPKYSMFLNKGLYQFKNKTTEYTFSSTQEIVTDATKDWSIATDIIFYPKTFGSNAGILWGGNNNSEYNFIIHKDGYYSVSKYENDSLSYLIDRTYIDELLSIGQQYVNTKITYTLKVSKVNNMLKFYINDTFVGRIFHEAPFGNSIGYTVGENSFIESEFFLLTSEDPKYSISDTLPFLEITNLQFITESNGKLSAYQKGVLSFTLKNNGGLAQDIEILLLDQTEINHFIYSKTYNIDSIAPGGVKTIHIPIATDYYTLETDNEFKIMVSEINSQFPILETVNIRTTDSEYSQNNNPKTDYTLSCIISIISILIAVLSN